MSCCNEVSVVIPSLDPTDKLEQVIAGLVEAGFSDIIVVNDGSDADHTAPFERIKEFPGCTILTHPQNLGKGAALKTAFSHFLQTRAGKIGVVTADGDGQHLPDDIAKCAAAVSQPDETVVIGVRDFKDPVVPKRNSLGNRITAFAFRILFGFRFRDTQTGLRGIPARHIPLMLDIKGSRFEYETNMLLELKSRGLPVREVEIRTVYDEGANKQSHFRPFFDSVLIFARILRYALSSILSSLVDVCAFFMATLFLSDYFGSWSIPACTAIARIISSFFNFNVNRRLVFNRNEKYGSHLWRYYSLVIVQMLVAAGLLWLLAYMLNWTQAQWLLTLLKIMVDVVLFFCSYYIQSNWVFVKRG